MSIAKKSVDGGAPVRSGRSGKGTDGRKMTKKEAKKILSAGPKFDRNWLTSPGNTKNSPYWMAPYMEVDLTYASMLFMDNQGNPINDKFMYTGAKVKIDGEFFRLGVDKNGLKEDLERAIDEVIKKHTKAEKSSGKKAKRRKADD